MVSKQQQQMRKERCQKLLQKIADEKNPVEIIVENDGILCSNSVKQKCNSNTF